MHKIYVSIVLTLIYFAATVLAKMLFKSESADARSARLFFTFLLITVINFFILEFIE